MNAIHGIFVEVDDVLDIALHEPFEALDTADDTRATAARRDRCCTDHAIDPRSGAAPHYDSKRRHTTLHERFAPDRS